jgi:hypothetical protein
MKPTVPRTGFLAAALSIAACSLLALYGCSGYFTPWSAFQPSHYDLGSSAFAPDATPLAMPDSIDQSASPTSAAWYSFPAIADTTYVIALYPQFGKTVLDVFDTATQSAIVSVNADTSITPKATAFWICKRSGTYYVRIRCDSMSYDGSVPQPGPFRLSLKSFDAAYGQVVDAYEPDGTSNSATRISFTTGNAAEVLQIHRTAPGDTDWYVFSPDYAHSYAIRTVGNVDTRIYLMSANRDSVEVSDDNSGGGKNAELTWTCPYSSGSYSRYFYVTGQTAGAYGISIVDKGY